MAHISIKSWMNSKIIIRQSPIEGLGMFAKADIKRGDKILVWGGDYTNKKGAESARKRGWPSMQWDDDLFSFDSGEDLDEHIINHSCDPNAWMTDAYTLSARRDIKKGDEITIDYALFMSDENYIADWACHCGSPACRGRVTGKDWRNPELQERYEGHFSPLINKRIKRLGPKKK